MRGHRTFEAVELARGLGRGRNRGQRRRGHGRGRARVRGCGLGGGGGAGAGWRLGQAMAAVARKVLFPFGAGR